MDYLPIFHVYLLQKKMNHKSWKVDIGHEHELICEVIEGGHEYLSC